MGWIYMITSPRGKSYIGQTRRPIHERLKEHEKGESKGCRAIYNAIKKHGWDILEKDYYECPDEDLNKHEELMVEVLGTLYPDGYNLREGGGSRGKLSKETKEKIGDAHRGKNGYWYGKKQSEEHKQNNRAANLGRSHTKESIQKMVEATLGENNHASKRVYQYDVDGTFINSFGSSGEAARYLKGEGTSGSNIRACARGRRNYNTAHGFKWSYTLDVFM